MNYISKLQEITKDIITLEKYDLSDMSTPHTIRLIVDNEDFLVQYYENSQFYKLLSTDDYHDFLFLKFITLFECDSQCILEPYNERLNKLIDFSRQMIERITNGLLISFIAKHYRDIFKLSEEYHDWGIKNLTLRISIQFYSGLKQSGFFEFLVNEEPYFAFDNYESLQEIYIKEQQALLKQLMIDNIEKIISMRFNDICKVIEELYCRGYKEIAQESGRKVFKFTKREYENGAHIYGVQTNFKRAQRMLYLIKINEAKEIPLLIKIIDKKVTDEIMVTGHEFKYELSSKPYDNWMTENEGVFSLSRFLTISHSKDKEGLWQSHIDIESLKFKPSVIDLFSSSIGTNKYFSPSRIRTFEIHIASFSMALFYWLKNEKLINEFKKMFTFVIESIFELLDYNVEFENLSEDIEAIVQILSDKAEEKSSGIYLHMKAMFIISFLEKILRLVYSALDEKIFFEKNITLGSVFGSGENLNNIMVNVLGEHHLRWTRYYLLSDNKEVGLEYRNRLAHFRDIQVSHMTLPVFLKIVWIIISTINSILVNLINTDFEVDIND